MIKFIILFRQPEEPETFETVYQDFLALVERMPHIQRRQVAHITGSPQGSPEFYRILELYFDSPEQQRAALMSPVGQEAGKELQRLPADAVQLLFADVYEEAGGSTPPPASDEKTAEPMPASDEKAAEPAPAASAAVSEESA